MTLGRKVAAVWAIFKTLVFKCIKVASGQLRAQAIMSQHPDPWCGDETGTECDEANIN